MGGSFAAHRADPVSLRRHVPDGGKTGAGSAVAQLVAFHLPLAEFLRNVGRDQFRQCAFKFDLCFGHRLSRRNHHLHSGSLCHVAFPLCRPWCIPAIPARLADDLTHRSGTGPVPPAGRLRVDRKCVSSWRGLYGFQHRLHCLDAAKLFRHHSARSGRGRVDGRGWPGQDAREGLPAALACQQSR